MEDLEIGVYDAELYYSEKFEEWLELRKKQFQSYPNDESTRYRYAEALYETGRYAEALDYLTKFHNDNPEDYDINQLVLETLRKKNLKKDAFQWKSKPLTLTLNEDLEMMIIDKLKTKRKRKQSLNDIYLELIIGNLLEFNETDLMHYLKNSQNFKVNGDLYHEAIVERMR